MFKMQYTGSLTLDRPLQPQHAAYLDRFTTTPRVMCSVEHLQNIPDPLREAVALPLGPEGAYFVGLDIYKENIRKPVVINARTPPQGIPAVRCYWRLEQDHTTLKYTGTDNLYCCTDWLQYLLDHFLTPWGYQLYGEIRWQGEEGEDRGSITVHGSIVQSHLDETEKAKGLARPDEPIYCEHSNAYKTELVCMHLAGQRPDKPRYRWFTGRGKQQFPICKACATNFTTEHVMPELRQICWRCSKEAGAGYRIVGQPEILVRPSTLSLSQQRITLPLTTPLLAFEPMHTQGESLWLALTAESDLMCIDLMAETVSTLMHLPDSQLDLTEPISLHLSPDNEFVAIANTLGQHGLVINLSTRTMTMPLARDDYNTDVSTFPIAFFKCEDRLLLIHSTEWCCIDFSDPYTGELLSARTFESFPGKERLVYTGYYFHAGLSISPDQEWIVDNGWVWHPVGTIVAWKLRRWVKENLWEPEEGPSWYVIHHREGYWDGPLCWINEQILAVWGYGDNENLLAAVLLFDITTGEELGWFAGPEQGTLVFDEYLFSLAQEHGLSAWDVTTGERVGAFPDFQPTHYHRGARQFVRIDTQHGTVLIGTVAQ